MTAEAERSRVMFFIGNMSHSGGTERVLSVIANGLSDRGFAVSVISLWGDGQTVFPLNDRIPVYWVEKERKQSGILGNLRYLAALFDREKPDFLVDVDIILACYSIFMKWRRQELYWISWEHFHYYYHFERNNFLRKIVRRVVARYSDQLIVMTDEDKGYHEKNLKLRCGIRRIYNPVPYEDIFEKKEEKPLIFAAGRLTEAKGFDLLIDSWKRLERKYPGWSVMIAGEGMDRRKLERKAKEAGLQRLQFVGNVKDIEKYYREAAIFVLSSRNEGFAMVLLEAMCFSLPSVSYSCKTGPKEVISDGENGFLVEPGDTEGFAEKMELLMNDEALRKRMGAQAAKTVMRFHKESILDQWEMLLGV